MRSLRWSSAVVAEEIRQLSENTKDASTNITNIIKELNEDTKRANESIDNAVKGVNRQNELIEETMDSSNVIYDHITQLSATSEEVTASTTEALESSNSTVNEVEKCRQIFEAVNELALDMQKY